MTTDTSKEEFRTTLKQFVDRRGDRFRVVKYVLNGTRIYTLEAFKNTFWDEVYENINLTDVLWIANEHNAEYNHE